jgi:hypothetical protein
MTIARLRTRGLILLLALSTAVVVGRTPLTARAEEQGLSVKLAYMYGYSNAGPTNVYGTARLWPSEGVAVLDAHNMPRQENSDIYVSWIVNTTTGVSLRLGAFNADDAGNVSQDITFNSAPPQGANALLVTVQHSGDPLAAPAAKRSLAGYFPPLNVAPPAPVLPPPHTRANTTTRGLQRARVQARAQVTRPPHRAHPRANRPRCRRSSLGCQQPGVVRPPHAYTYVNMDGV